jgi:hypothetical protein
MNSEKELVTQQDLISIIEDFVSKCSGLTLIERNNGDFAISQRGDAKKIKIKKTDLVDVLVRKDGEGKEFVQVNLASGRRMLLTDQLVGFKPFNSADLESAKLPKVVTTLDLLSVFEAIEESVSSHTSVGHEDSETLKRVFNAILLGGEDIGFDLSTERSWLKRLPTITSKTSA